jgi:hypothetical protein
MLKGVTLDFQFVIPEKAGIQCLLSERRWVPAFAGTTLVLREL